MKFASFSLSSQTKKKIFRIGRNSVASITFGILLSFFLPSFVQIDSVSADTCNKLQIAAVKASSSVSGLPASSAIDNNLNTRWSSISSHTSWLQADLGSVKTVCSVAIAWYAGQTEKYSFTVSVSTDGINFKNVLSTTSSGTTSQYETYDFSDIAAKNVRITVVRPGELDSSQTYTQISEFAVYDASSSTPPPPPPPPTTNHPPIVSNLQTVNLLIANPPTLVDITLIGSDADKDLLTFSVVTPPRTGTVSVTGNIARFTLNAAVQSDTTDSFTYKAIDSKGASSNIATVPLKISKPTSPPPSSNMYDDFQSGDYSLNDGQISPNGKWHDIYNGGGSSGVQNDGTGNHVFFMYPMTSRSSGETHASAVETTQRFSNYELSFDVKTIKQLRQNSPPNPWEAATILFRQTDYWHYYAFVVKTNGIEFDKKDCNTCTDPVQGQQFLVTAANPTLKIGTWSNWKIAAVGNHITITIDGNKIIDYIDKTMSSQLGNGSIVLYNEDASAQFDNIKITPL